MILVVTDEIDTQVYSVGYYLDRMSVPYRQFNVADFPEACNVLFSEGDGHSATLLQWDDGRCLDCDSVTAVWYRKPQPPRISPFLSLEHCEHTYYECLQAMQMLYRRLSDRYWISSPVAIRQADDKLWQLQIARQVGFVVPDTIVTNCPDSVWAFYEKHGGNVIYKPVAYGHMATRRHLWEDPTGFQHVFTTKLTARSVDDLAAVKHAPGIFQGYVEKAFELRVTVVVDKVFAARIDSQASERGQIDWRKDIEAVAYSAFELDSVIAERCVEITRRLGVQYSAIDLIIRPDGQCVFLEANPNGQYGWIEELAALRISGAIAEALVFPRA